jgi:predicted ATPase
MNHCGCTDVHHPRRIVLTGGPGAGKTAVLELIRKALCHHVRVLPESAGILFGGGFPRSRAPELRRPAQRAIFYVQRELEATVCSQNYAIVLCDRGTIDGLAYWPGPEDMLHMLGTSLDEQLARYHAVIHLRTPADGVGYNFDNPLRIESPVEAAEIDERIALVWQRHPRRFEVPASTDFIAKARRAIELVERELPACCAAP